MKRIVSCRSTLVPFILLIAGVCAGHRCGAEEVLSQNVVMVEEGRTTTWFCIYKEEQWLFDVDDTTLAHSTWRTDAPYPPLDPRTAIKKANAVIKKFAPDAEAPTRTEIDLINVTKDLWVYVVRYDTGRGYDRMVGIALLMDGTIIIPKITSLRDPSKPIRQITL